MWNIIKYWFVARCYTISKFFVTTVVEVEPRSPFYPANAYVYIVLLRRRAYLAKEIKVDMTKEYEVDFEQLSDKVPKADIIYCVYPDNWHDIIEGK
ncbi:ATP-dependent exonuclease-like protein [Bacillus phage Shbh1]|uniref:ATP-dependent exonuclease-like protein n=1 Tax=Bacillus phage Shbh1 TaxID=1796992 RepID=A0A142F1A8_9CAUD|nr:ATP-dependent exonuclease-like protein [Bacillus phage Shbh1]AMQ66565.1 ATP-dependent exonuclease-like protein [Bacillus phage Shbh1]